MARATHCTGQWKIRRPRAGRCGDHPGPRRPVGCDVSVEGEDRMAAGPDRRVPPGPVLTQAQRASGAASRVNEYDALILHNNTPHVSGVYTDGDHLTAVYEMRMIVDDEPSALQ